MSPLKYRDETISEREFMFALPSFIIGITILSAPSQLASTTSAADGWVSIIIGGLIIALFSWLGAKLAVSFPNQNFLSYSTELVSKPIALLITGLFILFATAIGAYVVRAFSDIMKDYLFYRTPHEILALTFILIAIYAVSGSRAGLFRLNIMFLPIILFVIITSISFNIRWIELNNFLPLFQTSFKEYVTATGYNLSYYIGFGIVLFYIFLVEKPTQIPKLTLYGITIPFILYMIVFLTVIGVFGNVTTANLLHPTVILSKRVEFPGGVFERIESLFFVVWSMAIFNTTALALDSAVLLIQSIFKKLKKIIILFFLAPITYYLSMLPQNYLQVEQVGRYLNMFITPFTFSVIIILCVVAWIKGVFKND